MCSHWSQHPAQDTLHTLSPAPFRLWHSLSAPHTCSYRPQQMQMSLSCVIRGKRSLTSPWSALPAYLSQQQQQISTFFFGGNFLSIASLLFYLHLKQNPHRPCPCPRPGTVAQRVTRTYRLFIDNRVGGHLWIKCFELAPVEARKSKRSTRKRSARSRILPYQSRADDAPGLGSVF